MKKILLLSVMFLGGNYFASVHAFDSSTSINTQEEQGNGNFSSGDSTAGAENVNTFNESSAL